MSTESENNRRIARNTIALYVRMFVVMAVSLFTSRVILQTLGVDDYGIYNVVGGVVAMMGLLNTAMASSIQRYLSFELGKNDTEALKKTFNVCFFIYFILCGIFLLFAETIGLWFLNTKLTIPEERLIAANWVYQFAILSVINSLLVNPYNASIIAHERMGVYAYVSIIEVVLKLAIVYVLYIIAFDKLIVYGFLFLLMSIVVSGIYRIYCVRNFAECRFKWYSDWPLFKQLAAYCSWNLFGSSAALIKGQGLNILLNMFFSPAVNASRGIAYQINSIVSQFFSNFYTAVRPQITKYYAQGETDNMIHLVFRSSKFSFYLILLVSLPILIEAPFIIHLWLGQLPDYVVVFVRYIIVITAVDAMANPLMTAAHATGRIAVYQSTIGLLTMLNIPISYVFLSNGYSPDIVFAVSLAISVVCLFARLFIVDWLMSFPVARFVKEVLGTITLVSSASLIAPIVAQNQLPQGLWPAVTVCLITVASSLIVIFSVGITREERNWVIAFVKSKTTKKQLS